MTPDIDIALVQGPIAAGSDAGAGPSRELAATLGGECAFIGRTRAQRHPEHGALIALEYEAYAPMAERVLREIAEESARRHGCGFIWVRHSVGAVPVGEASVLIRVLAGHRNEAFLACREVIDRLKREAPIWKRERWERGETWQSGASPVGAMETAP